MTTFSKVIITFPLGGLGLPSLMKLPKGDTRTAYLLYLAVPGEILLLSLSEQRICAGLPPTFIPGHLGLALVDFKV